LVADINKVGTIGIGGASPTEKRSPEGTGFGDILKSKVPEAKLGISGPSETNSPAGVKFSQHAIERMTSRGISFKPEEMMKLNDAVDRAAKKGSRESLVLMGDNALIVSVKNRTVVTAMDREAMKENIFTNIDSTVIL
jgi:flagellar operon protein